MVTSVNSVTFRGLANRATQLLNKLMISKANIFNKFDGHVFEIYFCWKFLSYSPLSLLYSSNMKRMQSEQWWT